LKDYKGFQVSQVRSVNMGLSVLRVKGDQKVILEDLVVNAEKRANAEDLVMSVHQAQWLTISPNISSN
jgi:hypothetical protein